MDYKDITAIVILIIAIVMTTKFFPNSKLGSAVNYVKTLFIVFYK